MSAIKGTITILLVLVNTIILVPILVVFSLIKLLLPFQVAQRTLSKIIVFVAELWVSVNSGFHQWFHGKKIHVECSHDLDPKDWYLVVSNHISAADIPIVQLAFNKKIPFLKFFLKKELIWVPFLGVAWWALDFPFMRRYSKEFIQQNPHLKGKDLEATQKACEKFKQFPITVINYIEGTRYTDEKKVKQNSRYNNVLNPKAGGLGFVLGSMGKQLNTLLLVSLKYYPKPPTMWEYLKGDFDKTLVKVTKVEIPESIKGKNYITDSEYKIELQEWINKIWQLQDQTLEKM